MSIYIYISPRQGLKLALIFLHFSLPVCAFNLCMGARRRGSSSIKIIIIFFFLLIIIIIIITCKQVAAWPGGEVNQVEIVDLVVPPTKASKDYYHWVIFTVIAILEKHSMGRVCAICNRYIHTRTHHWGLCVCCRPISTPPWSCILFIVGWLYTQLPDWMFFYRVKMTR